MAATRDFEYRRASSVDEAIQLLGSLDDARLLAGGHSLIPTMKVRLSAPPTLIDLGGIPGLADIGEQGGRIRIGAMATHDAVASSDVVRTRCPALAEAAAGIGDMQVRNRGTIGGSVAHADPSADYPALLLALGATVEARSVGGTRQIDADDFFTGMFTTALEEGEMVTAVTVPETGPGQGAAYQKWVNPASRYAVVGVAVNVTVSGGSCTAARVAVTGAAATPFRVPGVESALVGTALDDASIAGAVVGMVQADDLMSDSSASAPYRAHLASVLTARALRTARERAGGSGDGERGHRDSGGGSGRTGGAPGHGRSDGAPGHARD